MNRRRNPVAKAAVALVGIITGIFYIASASYAQQNQQPEEGSLQQRTDEEIRAVKNLDTIALNRLSAIQKTLARAIQHLEAGHQQEALKELRQAQTSLETVRQSLGKQVEPPIVNARCPIMGSRINTTKVSASLTRMYDGRRVAFCCAGCPGTWDQLDDAQKAAKLTSAIGGSQRSQVQPQKAPARPQRHGASHGH